MFYVLVVCSGFLSVLLFIHLFLGSLVMNYEKKQKRELKLREEKVQESESLIRRFPDPEKAIEEMEKKGEELRGMGLTRKQTPRLIQLLGQAAAKLNINKVISIKPRDDLRPTNETLPAGLSKAYVEVVISCPYQVIGEYIKSLSELPATFIIESLNVEEIAVSPEKEKTPGKPVEQKSNELLATLILSTYMVWEL
jgi:hypothetical protein